MGERLSLIDGYTHLRARKQTHSFSQVLSNIREHFQYFIDNDHSYLLDESDYIMRLSPKVRYKLIRLLF